MIKNKFLLIIALSFAFFSCTEEKDPFLITKNSIGLLNDSTQVKDLKTVFKLDSIAKYNSNGEFNINMNDLMVYEVGGKHLLTLTPFQISDSTSTIKSIEVKDSRYITSKGVSSISTFKDIRDNYKVNRIDNALSNIIVVVNELNAYFTIDKEELPSNMRYDMNLKLDPIQIPDQAKIKTFYIHWF